MEEEKTPVVEAHAVDGGSFFGRLQSPQPLQTFSSIGERRKISSDHGGVRFAKLQESAQQQVLRSGTPPSARNANTAWTVHGGDHFANAIKIGQARAPNERVYLKPQSDDADVSSKLTCANIRNEVSRLPPMSPLSLKPKGGWRQRLLLNTSGDREMQAGLNSLAIRLASQQKSTSGTPAPSGEEVPLSPAAAPAAVTSLAEASEHVISITQFDFAPDSMKTLLGMGSFACVHKATRVQDGMPVAIKVFHRPVSRGLKSPSSSAHGGRAWLMDNEESCVATDEPSFRRAPRDPRRIPQSTYYQHDAYSFKAETKILADHALQHPHILAYLGHGFVPVGDGKLAGFIVTPFVPGLDLYTIIERIRRGGPISGRRSAPHVQVDLGQVVQWASQLASALSHMHKHLMVHRDIKETNLMIADDGSKKLVLLDLGMALRLMPSASSQQQHEASSTQNLAEGFGIVGYRAPEVQREQPYGLPVDIFAFGKVLYNLLGSIFRPPRARITLHLLCARVLLATCPPGPRSGWAYETLFCTPRMSKHLPVVLRQLVLNCLGKDPAGRPSAQSLFRTLTEYLK